MMLEVSNNISVSEVADITHTLQTNMSTDVTVNSEYEIKDEEIVDIIKTVELKI